jgi:Na+-transporting NADH:ubiquinone oxidoreductase subunit NqrB
MLSSPFVFPLSSLSSSLRGDGRSGATAAEAAVGIGITLDVFSSETNEWAKRDAVFGGVEASLLSPSPPPCTIAAASFTCSCTPDRVMLTDLGASLLSISFFLSLPKSQ